MDTRNQPAESLGYYPSEYITGRDSGIPRSTAEACLKPGALDTFWRDAIRNMDRERDSDIDEMVYVRELGPWDVTIKHHYRGKEVRGGDHYCGIWEVIHEAEESFEVVGAHDYDNDVELHGVVRLLNQYYKDHEIEILNRR